MVNDALMALLVCPLGKAPLRREGDTLICTRCGPRFSIDDDIPNMLIEEAELPSGCTRTGQFAVRSLRGCQARLGAPVPDRLSPILLLDSWPPQGRESAGQHDRRSVLNNDRVASLHLPPLPLLDLAIDPYQTGTDHRFGRASALAHPASLSTWVKLIGRSPLFTEIGSGSFMIHATPLMLTDFRVVSRNRSSKDIK